MMSEHIKSKLDAVQRASSAARDACGAYESCRRTLDELSTEYNQLGTRLMTDASVLPAWRAAATKIERLDAERPVLFQARRETLAAYEAAKDQAMLAFYDEHISAFEVNPR